MGRYTDFANDARIGRIFSYQPNDVDERRRFVITSYEYDSAWNYVFPMGVDCETGERLNVLTMLYGNRIVGFVSQMGDALYVPTIFRSKMRTEMMKRMRRYRDLTDIGKRFKGVIVEMNDIKVRTFSDKIVPIEQYY